MNPVRFLLFFILTALTLTACSSGPKVTRLNDSKVTDLSGKWNDSDSRMVSKEITATLLKSRLLERWAEEHGKKPVLIVGRMKNSTMEHINMGAFTADIEHSLIESGAVAFVAGGKARGAIRKERLDQLSNASEETIKDFGKEIGADFMFFGEILSFTDQVRGRKIVSYQIDMRLIDIERNTVEWTGQKRIKKEIRRRRFRM